MEMKIEDFVEKHSVFIKSHILTTYANANKWMQDLNTDKLNTDHYPYDDDLNVSKSSNGRIDTNSRAEINHAVAYKNINMLASRKQAFVKKGKINMDDDKCILFAYWSDVWNVRDISELFPPRTCVGIVILLPETFKLMDIIPIVYSEYKYIPASIPLLTQVFKSCNVDLSECSALCYYRTNIKKYNKQTIKITDIDVSYRDCKIPYDWAIEIALDSAFTAATLYLMRELFSNRINGFDERRHVLRIKATLNNSIFRTTLDTLNRMERGSDIYLNNEEKGYSLTVGMYDETAVCEHIILWRGWESTYKELFTDGALSDLVKKWKQRRFSRQFIIPGYESDNDLFCSISFIYNA